MRIYLTRPGRKAAVDKSIDAARRFLNLFDRCLYAIVNHVPSHELESPHGKYAMPYFTICSCMARTYFSIGKFETSKKLFSAAVEYTRTNQRGESNERELLPLLRGFGTSCSKTGDLTSAAEALQSALEIARSIGSHGSDEATEIGSELDAVRKRLAIDLENHNRALAASLGDKRMEPDRDCAAPSLRDIGFTSAGRQKGSSSVGSLRRFASVKTLKSIANSAVAAVRKPIASDSEMSCHILLAEPCIFLIGFDHDGHSEHDDLSPAALLRGKLQLNVFKNVKIKSVTLKLVGKARTEWPEGIPPQKTAFFEEEPLRTQALTFFHAMYESDWETDYGRNCTFVLKKTAGPSSGIRLESSSPRSGLLQEPPGHMSAKDLKRLSLQSVQSRSFGKGDSPMVNQVQAKGYKTFYPGVYEYSFELPIDHHHPETTNIQYGSVKWELETTIERAGAFKPNLQGTKDINIVRLPHQLSLGASEPISISRRWEDQLHYDIVISEKSFPIGSRIFIAFKFTPLDKIQVRKLKIFITEATECWTTDRSVRRKDSGKKILLLEKRAGKPLDEQYESSDVSVFDGREFLAEERTGARSTASEGRSSIDAEGAENLLGGFETTEIEMNVQIPTCRQMAKDKAVKLHPDCSWKNINISHSIKVSYYSYVGRSRTNREKDHNARLSPGSRRSHRSAPSTFRDQY